MKKLQNNFTTPEQSKRLLELGVPADSADCFYDKQFFGGNIAQTRMYSSWRMRHNLFCGVFSDTITPCWSVGRLMEIIAECYQVDMPFRYFLRGGMMESLINTFIDLREEIDFSKLEE